MDKRSIEILERMYKRLDFIGYARKSDRCETELDVLKLTIKVLKNQNEHN